MPIPHIFGAEGQARLHALLQRRPLLAFDFDGTLAPIVARPQDARPCRGVAMRMRALAQRFPVAIVSGRNVADLRERLGFEPSCIVGNHGAEEAAAHPDAAAATSPELDDLRARLRARSAELAALGVTVEDKSFSLALHYRLSRQREQAQAFIAELLGPTGAALRVFGGKMVVNVVPAQAADKAQALHRLVARYDADCAFFAGDDVNDEPVFASAPADWLTLRVGRDDPDSKAHFCLAGPHEMALLLERMGQAWGSARGR